MWLTSLGAIVKGYGLKPDTENSLADAISIDKFLDSEINDIRNVDALSKSIKEFKPDIIFHMAAQPIVRTSYKDPIETFQVNVLGTANILESSRFCDSVRAIVNITTDKCYKNNEWVWGYKETDPMGGIDPYSSSKGCSELVTASYRDSFFMKAGVGIATARAGNVIGGGDWAADRLIPDILKAFESQVPVIVRNPNATRPWQYVLDPLRGYLMLAEHLFEKPMLFSEGWNFGPFETGVKRVSWILNKMTELWPGSSWVTEENNTYHEARELKLDISKARAELGWTPTFNIEMALKNIIQWHQHWRNQDNMFDICISDIINFRKLVEDYDA